MLTGPGMGGATANKGYGRTKTTDRRTSSDGNAPAVPGIKRVVSDAREFGTSRCRHTL